MEASMSGERVYRIPVKHWSTHSGLNWSFCTILHVSDHGSTRTQERDKAHQFLVRHPSPIPDRTSAPTMQRVIESQSAQQLPSVRHVGRGSSITGNRKESQG
jgi:hypothetical protein